MTGLITFTLEETDYGFLRTLADSKNMTPNDLVRQWALEHINLTVEHFGKQIQDNEPITWTCDV
jgi:hypothetical protein